MAFHFIKQESQLKELEVLKNVSVLGVDTETAGVNPLITQQSRVRLLQVASHSDIFVIDMDRVDPWIVLREIFLNHNVVKIFHNAKFDMKMLLFWYGVEVNNVFCTYLAAKLVAAGVNRSGFSLSELCRVFLNRSIDKSEQASHFGGDLTARQIEYAALDAEVLLPLYEVLFKKIKTMKLQKVCQLEFRTITAVAKMELKGIYLDKNLLKETLDTYRSKLKLLENQLLDVLVSPDDLPGMNTLNLNAPDQVCRALNGLGINVTDTTDATLRPMSHEFPIINILLEHRRISKIIGSTLESLLNAVLPETGRVHASYHQIASASGRFACSDPNIQQVPREKDVRSCIQPEPGNLFVIADYSQVELRVAAGFSNDKIMIDAFSQNQDLHRLTAALTMNKPIDQVSKDERQAAKAINFGLIYAMGAKGLQTSARNSYGVQISFEQATSLRNNFFRNYQGIATWQREAERLARQRGFVRTASGRMRTCRNDEVRLSEILNIPIQGTAAEGLKCAMFLFDEAVKGDGIDACIVAIIHDEIIVEVKSEQANWAKQLLEMSMIKGIQWLVPNVTFEVEAVISSSWAEK